MRLLFGGVFFIGALAFQLRMISVFSRLKREVNAQLSEEQRIPEWGLSLLRGRVIRLHRYYFPASRLRREMYVAWYIEMALFLAALCCVFRIAKS